MNLIRHTTLAFLTLVIVTPPATAAPDVTKLAAQCNAQEKGKQDACKELVKIALGDKDPQARLAAASLLRDKAALAKIASSAQDPNVREAATAELDWQAALSPFSAPGVQAFVEKHAASSYAPTAHQILDDETAINAIVTDGPGSRFIIPPASTPPFIARSVGVNTVRGRSVFETVSHNGVPDGGLALLTTIFGTFDTNVTVTTNIGMVLPLTLSAAGQAYFNLNLQPNRPNTPSNPIPPCGERSVFVVKGKVANVTGDPAEPIRLVYLRDLGVVYLSGRGSIASIANGVIGEVIFKTQ